jgi:hypothetical protein
MSEASYLLLSSAFLIPQRSTALSNPTRVSTAEIALVMSLAISHPTTRMIRNTTNFGTNVATLDQAFENPEE